MRIAGRGGGGGTSVFATSSDAVDLAKHAEEHLTPAEAKVLRGILLEAKGNYTLKNDRVFECTYYSTKKKNPYSTVCFFSNATLHDGITQKVKEII